MVDALDILIAARAKVADPKDWGKGSRGYNNYKGRSPRSCCAAEAIEECIPWTEARKSAFRAFHNAAGLEDKFGKIVDWNDAPERTHSEVLATFDLAIATLRLS